MSSPSGLVDPLAPLAAPLRVDALFDTLSKEERATVVTPNRRLAVYLKHEFDAVQRRAGKDAWATPDIIPLATFLERSYRAMSLRAEDAKRPRILDAAQNQLLWEQVVRASGNWNELLSLSKTAKQAAAAWSLAHSWDLFSAMRRIPLAEDAAVFLAWAQRFEQLCAERGVMDIAALPAAMVRWMHTDSEQRAAWREVLPHKLFTAGFDIVTPQQQTFLRACVDIGVFVMPVDAGAPVAATQCRRFEFATEDAELQGCAAWVRQHLLSDPHQRIAIVVPDLRAKRGAVVRTLTDALQPGQRAHPQSTPNRTSAVFNVSLGLALADYA
ncbi:MAG: hypothetical protein ABL931_13125, partial [Usitatibacteraceae bacterium]